MDFLGIDPGKQGALALFRADRSILVTPMLVAGKDLDLAAIAEWIDVHCSIDTIAYIEKVHAMPGQGVTSMFSFGFSAGAIHGVVATIGIPIYLVTPQAWKKKILSGTSKDKASAISYCRRAFPEVSLLATRQSTKPHVGIADAICIAVYAFQETTHLDIRPRKSIHSRAGVAT